MKKIILIVAIMLLKTTVSISQDRKEITLPINIGKEITEVELTNIIDDKYYKVDSFTINEYGNTVDLYLFQGADYQLIINGEEYFNFTVSYKQIDISSDMEYIFVDGTITFY